MQKPTINLSINNNVQNVIVTPAPGQYSGRQGANGTTGHYGNVQASLQQPSGGIIGNLNGGPVNPNAASSH
jgi:hypothetical protein